MDLPSAAVNIKISLWRSRGREWLMLFEALYSSSLDVASPGLPVVRL